MNAQQLKNSILQMAVQGKLVPQNPNDEPASVLLERIRAEKEKLIKEGKIKKEKNPSYIFRGEDNLPYEKVGKNEPVCIADEVPFEIPDNWCWCRLGEYAEKVTDQVASGSFASLRENVPSLKEPDYAIMVKTADFSNGFTRNLTYTTQHGYEFLENSNLFGGELILSNIGSIGKCFIVPKLNYKMTLAPNSVMVRLTDDGLRDYLYNFILSPQGFSELNSITSGTAMRKFNKTDLKTILVPIPPVKEQQRIVSIINAIQPYIDEYDVKYQELTQLNDSFPELMKKAILQQAVIGKLVPQDPNDEPASVLLERIRAEKQALIKSGKLKKDKHESIIYRRDNSLYEEFDGVERCIDNELPFEIPESWAVIRLNDIGIYRKGPFGSSLTKDMFIPKGPDTIKVYEQKNAIKKDHTLGNYYISRKYFAEKMSSFAVNPGDIIVSCAGTIGETYVLPEGIEEGIINQALMRMTIFAPINIDYFLIYFDYVLKENARDDSKGSAIKNIPPFEIFKNLLLPVPPINEQARIVDKLEVLFSKL